MSSLKSQIEESFKKALTERNEAGLSLFRMIKSAIKNKEIELGHELDDTEMTVLLEKEAKQRRDSIEQFKNGGREELAQKEQTELDIIASFLPEKMNEEEIRGIVKQVIGELEGKTQDFGKIMGVVMAELKGKADGALVQKIVREETGA